jgi:hypothetical protein
MLSSLGYKIEGEGSSEKLAYGFQATRRHIPDYSNLHSRRSENRKSRILCYVHAGS